MKVKASLKYLRISPRKVRLVTDLIKGMDVTEAKSRLQLLTKGAAKPLLKLLNSAVASAKHNFDLKEKNLYISKIITNEGSTLKRWRARARGVAAPIMKRTSHIILELSERALSRKIPTKRKPEVAQVKTLKPRDKPRTENLVRDKKIPEVSEKPEIPERKSPIKKKPKKKEFLKKGRFSKIRTKIFRRKSI